MDRSVTVLFIIEKTKLSAGIVHNISYERGRMKKHTNTQLESQFKKQFKHNISSVLLQEILMYFDSVDYNGQNLILPI